jgi:hypothetical protein
LYFTMPNGQVVSPYTTPGSLSYPFGVASKVTFGPGGLPYIGTDLSGVDVNTAVPVYIYWTSTEPICLSPFVFSDHCEWETGLFGINNIQLIANLLPSSQLRNVRNCIRGQILSSGFWYGRQIVPGSLAWNTNVPSVFTDATLNVTFLTPNLAVPLPPKSVVPYMEFPRYISQTASTPLMPGQSVQLTSQTITLPTIPDLLIVYVKPNSGNYTTYGSGLPANTSPALNTDYTQADWYYSVGNWNVSVGGSFINGKPLNINFDNFSGLLSSVTVQELYNMSVHNGLNMDWDAWCGVVRAGDSAGGNLEAWPWVEVGTGAAPSVTATLQPSGSHVASVGSILVLKPSQDITLQAGQAPSLVGNFTLQFNLQITNQTNYTATPTLYVITANSGFFESIRGSSRIIKGVLSEQDIISAGSAPAMSRAELDRLVGGGTGGFSWSSLANIANKAIDIYHKTKPHVSGLVNTLGDEGVAGTIKRAAKAVGYGTGGVGAGTGGAGAGRKSLNARLM